MDIVFSFNYENNEYLVIKNNNQYIPCKREKGIINYEITNKELYLINYVFNKIKTTDNRIKLSNFEYKDKEYQHLYDKTNNYHIFLNLDGSEIDKNIFSELNMSFNYQSDVVYINLNKKENKLKRLVKLGKTMLVVLATSSALISPLSKLTPVHAENIQIESLEIAEEKEQESNLTDEEKIENLKNAINNNDKLAQDEKDFMISCFDIIYDNIDVINYDLVKDRFEKLYVVYDENNSQGSNAAGTYSPITNEIHMHNSKSFMECTKSTFTHEFYHSLQGKHNDSGLFEPLNSIFTNEYKGVNETDKNKYKSYDVGYNEIKPYIYTMMEIIGSEPFRKYNFTGDKSYIKDELMNIINDEAKYEELISYLNVYTFYIIYLPQTIDNMDFRHNIYVTLNKKIEKILEEYYIAKYNKPIEENLEIMYNFNKKALQNFLNDDSSRVTINYEKVYFNNKCKDEYLKPELTISKKIDIDENDIYKYLDLISILKDKKVIDEDEYNNLLDLYQSYINKEIDFEWFRDENSYGHNIGVNKKLNAWFEGIAYDQPFIQYIDSDYLKGKSKQVKKSIQNTTDESNKYIIKFSTFQADEDINCNNIINIENINNTTIFSTKKREYKVNSKYLKKLMKEIYTRHIDELVEGKVNTISFSIHKKILTIIVNSDEIYNISLKTGKKVGVNKIIKLSKYTNEQIMEQAVSNITDITSNIFVEYDTDTNLIENKDKKIKKAQEMSIEEFLNNGLKTAHFNENGDLTFVSKIYCVNEFGEMEEIISDITMDKSFEYSNKKGVTK